MSATRKIVQIDEEKCDGCGKCVPSCAEGAIRIVDGKARLVADLYCDGLGACLGECPLDAISIIEREAEAFDEAAVEEHLARLETESTPEPLACGCPGTAVQSFQGCPGSAVQNIGLNVLDSPPSPGGELSAAPSSGDAASALTHWPIQLHLVPPGAPFLQNADLLLAADCVPFAYADFHKRFLKDRAVLIGCPKLDDLSFYVDRLANILSTASLNSLTVLHMEVPCCTGLVRIAEAAIEASGVVVPLQDVTISVRGEVIA